MLSPKNKYFNCIAHNSSEGNLLIGSEYSLLIDCGMTFCAGDTINKVRDALEAGNNSSSSTKKDRRKLDYIFLTHTHYDHLGALPLFKKEWPNLKVITSMAGAGILLKDTPRRVIRELSMTAALLYKSPIDASHDDDVFKADIITGDGDKISLGDLTIEVYETPGHTRDSLSCLVPELELLVLCESFGVLMPDSSVFPCFLSSYAESINSIKKLSDISHTYLSLPHRGLVTADEAEGFFEKSMEAAKTCHDFILGMKEEGLGEDEMLDSFYRQYSSETLRKYQPKEAFMLNAKAMISCVLREN